LPEHDITLICEPVPGFLVKMVEDGGLLPHLKKRLAGKPAAKETT
jgi:3-isopropylmalate/(R)-2-methylmalate dehydratase small subunit